MTLDVGVADEQDRLPVAGFKGTPEEIERQWYEQVYRGHGDSMAQLTWRAVLVGSCLGGVLSLTNLYIGLKAGWGFGVAITACILSHAIWTSLLKAGLAASLPSAITETILFPTSVDPNDIAFFADGMVKKVDGYIP
jgi:hypothetical protein